MTVLLISVGILLLFFNLFAYGALVEMYLQLKNNGDRVSSSAPPSPIEIRSGLKFPGDALDYGKPLWTEEIDRYAIAILSTSCSTCEDVADALPTKFSPRLMLLLEAPNIELAKHWKVANGLKGLSQVQYDRNREVADAMGISIVPSCVLFEFGEAVAAFTLPNAELVEPLLDWVNGQPAGPFDVTTTNNLTQKRG